MKAFLRNHLDDVMIASGSGLIVYATAQISWIAALYVTGGILVACGVLIGLGRRGEQ
jgi:ABC-type uncharacterized transport system permease subunit